MAQRNGTGMFPREVMNCFPLLPLEEEGRLSDMPSGCSPTTGGPRCWTSTGLGSPGDGFSPKHSWPEWDSRSRDRVASLGLPVFVDTVIPTASDTSIQLP
jgi:hypothetical protein